MGSLDWIVLGIFFLAMIGIIVYVMMQKDKNTEDYFLAGKNAGWVSIGSSIFASNIGSEHLVGLAGVGFISGMAMAHWEIQAWIILLLGWVFVPFYSRINIFTMPEFLERRFSAGSRTILSMISLISYVLTKVAVTVYAGGVVFKEVFGIESMWGIDFFWVSAIGLVLITGIYTVLGGMKAVMYTSVLQSPVLLIGSIVILIVGIVKVGGWAEVQHIAGPNMHLIRSASDPEFPWPGVIVASMVIGFWYWCTDQFIVQRVLSGRNQKEARRGAILGGYFKLLPVFIFLIPGMIAFALSQKGLLTVNSSDSAFAAMVAQLLPAGFKGVVVCGLIAALMSSLASLFNSSAALFVGDFYKKFRPDSSEHHLLVVGRIATAVVVVLGVVWIPVMLGLGKVLYDYLQAVQGLLAPAIATVFLLGVFWKRTTAKGALWGMIIGFAIGMFRLALNVTIGAKAGLVMQAEKLINRITDVTEYTREMVVTGIQNFSQKIGEVLPSGTADALQASVKEAAGSMSAISPQAKEHATALLTQVSGSIDKMFTDQYGFLFQVASVNSYIFTAFLFLFCIILVVVISLLTQKPTEKQLQYTIHAATAEDKAITRASWNKWDVIHTVIILGIVALFYFYFW
jgi:solute:Na+ symporter, SSS family